MSVIQGGIKAPAIGRLVTARVDKSADLLSLSPKIAGDFGQPSVGTSAVHIGTPLGLPEATNLQ